jgi:V/A-type H+-transporting ATPase subunit E
MKTLDKGQDKIQKICEILRDETLAPAKKQAEEIVKEAQKKAESLLVEAQKAAHRLLENARSEIEQEKNVFEASLSQAAKQCLEALRQNIETRFFNTHLSSLIEKNANHPNLIASLINAIIQALEKEGLAANLTVLIPKTIPPREVNELLLNNVAETLKEGSVLNGPFAAGVQVKIANKKMTIDLSEEALKDLLSQYVVRKDFRKLFFDSQQSGSLGAVKK